MYFMDLLNPSQWLYCFSNNLCKQITGFEAVHFVLSDCVNYYMYAQQHQSSIIMIVDESGHTISMRNLCNLVMQGVILPWLCITHSKVILTQLYYHSWQFDVITTISATVKKLRYLCWNCQLTLAVAVVGQVYIKYPHFHYCVVIFNST